MSDLEKIKEQSKFLFDLVSIETASKVCGFDGLIISHPYSNSGLTAIYENGNMEMVNIVEDKKAAKRFRQFIFDKIDQAESISRIYILLNTPYKMLWFNLINEYLDEKDYAWWLKEVWITSENPNGDVNVPLSEVKKWFKKANKKYLMSKDEMDIYNAIPDTVTVYRGVSKNRNPNGLSYSIEKEKAEWFQKRFADEKNPGFLIEKKVKKEDIFCFFGNGGEAEVVVNVKEKYND